MLVILSLIMGLVAPRVLGYLSDARVRSTKLQIDSLTAALDLFYLDAGRYPSQSEGLAVLIKRPPSVDNWNGPYLKQTALPVDPWGHRLRISRARPGWSLRDRFSRFGWPRGRVRRCR